MDNQVTDLPTSKKLQEIMGGVETGFSYHRYQSTKDRVVDCCIDTETGRPRPTNNSLPIYKIIWQEVWHLVYKYTEIHTETFQVIPAYTFQDLLEKLPKHIASSRMTDRESVSSSGRYLHSRVITPYYIHYYSNKYKILEGSNFSYSDGDTITQATAQLLLWCCEQGHLQEGGDEL